jgi:hypothetical protein
MLSMFPTPRGTASTIFGEKSNVIYVLKINCRLSGHGIYNFWGEIKCYLCSLLQYLIPRTPLNKGGTGGSKIPGVEVLTRL